MENMKAVRFILLLLHFNTLMIQAMDQVIEPNYFYGEWQTTSLQYKSFSREIHKELFCPLRERLSKSSHVKTVYACDAPDSIEQMHVLVITNHVIKQDTRHLQFLNGKQMSHGVCKNMRKFLSAYVQLSKLYSWGYITLNEKHNIALTELAHAIASPNAKTSLRRVCKQAKLKFADTIVGDAH